MRAVPLSCSALTAVGASLLLVPAAEAGWTSPRSLPFDGFTPTAVAIDARGRGAVVGGTRAVRAPGEPPLPAVVTARLRGGTALGPPRVDLHGLFATDLVVDPRGATAVVGQPASPAEGSTALAAQQVLTREALAAFGAPTPPVPDALDGSLRVARNARGDVAAGWRIVDGTVVVSVRPAGGAFSAPVVLSAPGASGLRVALGEDGTVAAGWIRAGIAEVRVRERDGTAGAASALGGGAQEQPASIAVAVGPGGRVLAAAAVAPPGQTVRQLLTVDRPGRGAFTAPRQVDAAPLIDSPAAAIGGSERLVAWRRGSGVNVSYVRAAARRGSRPLRTVRVPRVLGARGVANDRAISEDVRAGVADDGGAVLAFTYHGAVHAAVRAPRRRDFDAPRAVSALGGGSVPDGLGSSGEAGRPLAVARGGRAILAFPRLGDLRPQVVVLRRGGRDRSTRSGAKPPRLRYGRPTFDLSSTPARVRFTVDCDRACRTAFRLTARGSGSAALTVRRLVPRKGSRRLDAPVSASLDRVLRRSPAQRLRSLVVVAQATTRYGGQTTDRRTYRNLPTAPKGR